MYDLNQGFGLGPKLKLEIGQNFCLEPKLTKTSKKLSLVLETYTEVLFWSYTNLWFPFLHKRSFMIHNMKKETTYILKNFMK